MFLRDRCSSISKNRQKNGFWPILGPCNMFRTARLGPFEPPANSLSYNVNFMFQRDRWQKIMKKMVFGQFWTCHRDSGNRDQVHSNRQKILFPMVVKFFWGLIAGSQQPRKTVFLASKWPKKYFYKNFQNFFFYEKNCFGLFILAQKQKIWFFNPNGSYLQKTFFGSTAPSRPPRHLKFLVPYFFTDTFLVPKFQLIWRNFFFG